MDFEIRQVITVQQTSRNEAAINMCRDKAKVLILAREFFDVKGCLVGCRENKSKPRNANFDKFAHQTIHT